MEKISVTNPVTFRFKSTVTPGNYLKTREKRPPPGDKYGVTVLSNFCTLPKPTIAKKKPQQIENRNTFSPFPQPNASLPLTLMNQISQQPALSHHQLPAPPTSIANNEQTDENPQTASMLQIVTQYSTIQPDTTPPFYRNSYHFLLNYLIQTSIKLVNIYRNEIFDFLSDATYTAQKQDLVTEDSFNGSAKNIIHFIEKIFQIIESELNNKPYQFQQLIHCIERLNRNNLQHKIDLTVILFLLGMYITPKGIFFNIDYQFPDYFELPVPKIIPATTFERIFFFQIPSEVITCLIEIGYQTSKIDYRSIARNAKIDERKKLLEITTHVNPDSLQGFQILQNTMILNDIISNQDWNILEFAIQLGAQPILSEGSTVVSTIQQLRHLIETTSSDCLVPIKTSENLLNKVDFLKSFSDTCWSFFLKYHFHEKDETWDFFLDEIDLLIQEFETLL